MAKGYYHYWAFKDYEPALAEFALASKGLPGNTELISGIGFVYRRQARWEEAAARLHAATELDPQDPTLFANLAETYEWMRRFDDAASACEQSTVIAPDQIDRYIALARIYRNGYSDVARARATLERMPDQDALWARHGWYDHEMFVGNFEQALEWIASATEPFVTVERYQPTALDAAVALDRLGRSEEARRSYESALAELEAQLALRPDDFRLHASLGRTLAGLGRKDEAIRAGEHAVEIYPVSKDASAGPVAVEHLAMTYLEVGELDRARERIEELLSIPYWITEASVRADAYWAPLQWD